MGGTPTASSVRCSSADSRQMHNADARALRAEVLNALQTRKFAGKGKGSPIMKSVDKVPSNGSADDRIP